MRLPLLILVICFAASGCAGGLYASPYGYAPAQAQNYQPVRPYNGGYAQAPYYPSANQYPPTNRYPFYGGPGYGASRNYAPAPTYRSAPPVYRGAPSYGNRRGSPYVGRGGPRGR